MVHTQTGQHVSLQPGDVVRMRNIPHVGNEVQIIRDQTPLEFPLLKDTDKTLRIVYQNVVDFTASLRDIHLLDLEPLTIEGTEPHDTKVFKVIEYVAS